MCTPSFTCWASPPICETLSEPAKSTKFYNNYINIEKI